METRHSQRINVSLWYWGLAEAIGTDTDYGVEKYFYPNKIKPRKDGGTGRSGKFNSYKHGRHEPHQDIVDKGEREFPGSSRLLNHPFWVLIENPDIEISQLYIELAKLRPEVSKLLFYSNEHPGKVPFRKLPNHFVTCEKLSKMGDLDALTAIMGLALEDLYFGRFQGGSPVTTVYFVKTLSSFCHVFSRKPFIHVARPTYEKLKEKFFVRCTDPDWHNYYKKYNIDILIGSYQAIYDFISEMKILKHYKTIPHSCINLALSYFPQHIVLEFNPCFYSRDTYQFEEIWKRPEMRKMIRSLRRWERRQLAKNSNTYTM